MRAARKGMENYVSLSMDGRMDVLWREKGKYCCFAYMRDKVNCRKSPGYATLHNLNNFFILFLRFWNAEEEFIIYTYVRIFTCIMMYGEENTRDQLKI